MIKIQIKSRWGSVLFEYEKENNTMKDTLIEAVKKGANLEGANLKGANLYGASLEGAKEIPYVPLNCPSDGAFTAWKKVYNFLIKLEIPADAKRLSSVSMKCRCDKAKVISIVSLENNAFLTEITNHNYTDLTYRVGEMVYPDYFDEDRWNECSNGIHFFINKQDAINY